jgi:Inositol monophosphatase family
VRWSHKVPLICTGKARFLLPTTYRDFVSREIGSWPWDICAGSIIVQEAGGCFVGSPKVFKETLSSEAFGEVTEEVLTGRKYLMIRAISDTKASRIPTWSIVPGTLSDI